MIKSKVKRMEETSFKIINKAISIPIIRVSKDTLRLRAQCFENSIEQRSGYIAALSVFLTILLVLCTADFKDLFGLNKYYWNAIFVVGAAVTLVFFIVLLKAYRAQRITLDKFMQFFEEE